MKDEEIKLFNVNQELNNLITLKDDIELGDMKKVFDLFETLIKSIENLKS